MKFNKNLSAIHAYLCADGYVIKNHSTQKHKYCHIGLRYSYYSREWKIPPVTGDCLKVWRKAFFDCKGWVFLKSRQNRHIGLDSVNYKGLITVKEKLSELDVKSIFETKKNGKIFRLLIYGKDNLIKFQKEIGFLHPAKDELLKQAIDDYVDLRWKIPMNSKEQRKFIIDLFDLEEKRLRKTSIMKENIAELKRILKQLFNIDAKIYNHERYYELVIPKKDHDKIKGPKQPGA